MVQLRTVIATICILLVILIFYTWFAFNPKYEINLAAENFAKGDYDSASKIIKDLKNKIPDSEYHLYLAYISRENSSLQESNEELKLAEEAAKTESESKPLLEIYLNQAFNAYLTRKPESMQEPLDKSSKIAKDKQWVAFFQALQEYLKQNYQPALDHWQKPLDSGYLSPWMKKTFKDTFEAFWYSTHLAQANIAIGNYFSARQQLEKESKLAKENQLDEINLLLGLSYIKEAEEKPYLASTPYYKLALSYLNKVPMQKSRFAPYRVQILSIIQNQINLLIASQSLQDLSFYAGILESWQDKTGLQNLQNKLIELFEQQVQVKNWKDISVILKVLNHQMKPEQSRQVEEKLNTLFDKALNEEDISSMNQFWEAMRSFAGDPQAVSRKIAYKTAAFTLDIIPIDNEDLFLTTPYLEFWMSIEKDPSTRFAFSTLLLNIAENMWIQNEQPTKALTLVKITLSLPVLQDQPRFHQLLTERLALLYAQSREQGNTNLLHSVLKAMNELHVNPDPKKDKSSALKKINEAESLLNSKDYSTAQRKINWALELLPDNQKALRIAGLTDYYLANYNLAKAFLSKIQNPDAAVKEALAIANIITENAAPNNDLIEQAIKNHLAGNDVSKRLGLGLLINGKPEESLEWLSKVSPSSPEILAGKSYAYYQLGDWKKALEEYSKLPEPYKKIMGMQRIALESTAGLGQTEQAEIMLKDILHAKPRPKPTPSFEYLNKEFFEGESPDFIAGVFYKTWKHDNGKALEYLYKIKDPSPNVLIAIGEILLMQQKYPEARSILKKAFQTNTERLSDSIQLKHSFALLALANEQLDYPIEAARNFIEFFDAFPKEILYRNDFARVLMKLRRFDAAMAQFNFIEKTRDLAYDEKIECIDCLIHLGHFKEASLQAQKYLSADIPLPLAEQVKLAQLMLITGDIKIIQAVLHRIPEQKYRSLEVNIALIDLWMAQGDYEKASSQIKLLKPALEKTSDGLMLLARYYANDVNASMALEFAKKALKLNPLDDNASQFIVENEVDLAVLKQNLLKIQSQIQEDPNNSSLRMEYAKQLMETAIKSNFAQKENSIKDSIELNQAKLILKELSQSLNNLPAIYFLLGKALFLQMEGEKGKVSLEEALHLDLSYTNAYRYLSRIYLGNGQLDEAIQKLQLALRFEPNNSELWFDLADLFQRNNNVLDAMTCLEKSIQFKPRNTQAYVKLGEIMLNSENPEDAKIALETALKFTPNDTQALKLLLVTLYNPFLAVELKDKKALEEQQKSVYNSLHKLDPKLAEDIFSSLHQETAQ